MVDVVCWKVVNHSYVHTVPRLCDLLYFVISRLSLVLDALWKQFENACQTKVLVLLQNVIEPIGIVSVFNMCRSNNSRLTLL